MQIPFIYNFSSSVVPKPIDWSDLITISGYWFLDNPDLKWEPSPELLTFIKSAKEDNVPIVYIGWVDLTGLIISLADYESPAASVALSSRTRMR